MDLSSITISGAGSAPARRISDSSFVSATVKLPVIWPLPKICDWMVGAETTLPSSTIANGRPILAPVTRPNFFAPSAFRVKLTAGWLFWSKLACAVSSNSPLTITRFSTTKYSPSSLSLGSRTVPGGTRPRVFASTPVIEVSTSWNVSFAVRPRSRLISSGSSTPGSWTRMRSAP